MSSNLHSCIGMQLGKLMQIKVVALYWALMSHCFSILGQKLTCPQL